MLNYEKVDNASKNLMTGLIINLINEIFESFKVSNQN